MSRFGPYPKIVKPEPTPEELAALEREALRGEKGDQGEPGQQGEKGDQGPEGQVGPSGPVGPAGLIGPSGRDGAPGKNGTDGERGEPGPAGPRGMFGPPGPQGPPGPPGKDGTHGKAGAQGRPGLAGTSVGGGQRGIAVTGVAAAAVPVTFVEFIGPGAPVATYTRHNRKIVYEFSAAGESVPYNIELDEVPLTGVTYVGEAAPGSAQSAAVWRIKRITESGVDVSTGWADGTSDFTKVWDNRLTYSYS